MTFELSDKLVEWMEKHEKTCKTYPSAGEHFVFEFLPSGIVECRQTVKCLCCGAEKTEDVYQFDFL